MAVAEPNKPAALPARLKVAAIQQAFAGTPAATFANTVEHIRAAAEAGAQLVCLQELHGNRYFCQHESEELFDLAEPLNGPTSQQLGALAAELGIVIVGSIFERRAQGVFHNTAVVFDNSPELAGFYRKMHIPDDPGYYEKYYFTPGDAHSPGFQPIVTSVGKLGILVCWDQWYPEAARLMALAGANLLIYPTAIGWDPIQQADENQRQLEAWMTVQRGHAIANHLPVISTNRCGFEGDPSGQRNGIQFWGNSFICGQQGEFLARASEDQQQTLLVDIDMSRTAQLRRTWPYMRDRRIEAFGDISKRWRD
ncbi:carbon-nitrogen hydrolase [Parathalassolituus penaei]|uniref:Carbon-nitrogen hydrolase n=1 Tax=Parathalassolituus penaei TaxID=2997323 RepID=A0A9X3EF68_9GAMM|nr:carbon-nitrogen hydrolase [Parathalassolituus penaei]MCY0966432.1 carbon-nitrogen hydrolase [Parathalassolituus penaei]